MRKVLVTGANGFIGKYAVLFLIEKGYEVHAISTKEELKNPPHKVNWHIGNLFDDSFIHSVIKAVKPTDLVHLAWYTKHGLYWESQENLKWVQASLNLIQEFQNHGGVRVVVAGTCAEYDWNYGFCSEESTPINPKTLYGTCKAALHDILANYSKNTGLSYAWGRIFSLYGPNEYEKRLVPSIILNLLKGEKAYSSHGKQYRDYLHVQDVAEAIITLLASSVTGPVNICSGKPVTLREIIYKIALILNGQELIRLGTIKTSQDDPPLLVGDNRRLRDEVGWKPKFTLDEGLLLTTDSFKEAFGGENNE